MSSNRLSYDTCAYKVDINQSCGPLSYLLNPMPYENCNKCRHEFGCSVATMRRRILTFSYIYHTNENLCSLSFILCAILDTVRMTPHSFIFVRVMKSVSNYTCSYCCRE